MDAKSISLRMNQNERLNYLVEQFKEDSGEYRDIETPADPAGKKRILRSLMNIRMPRAMVPSVLAVQDEDLKERNRENGDLCMDNRILSVAFCCISTGVFRFPNQRAAEIAVQTVTDWLDRHPDSIERVIFNVFKDEDKRYYEQELR